MNGVIVQFFHWYRPGEVWNEFINKADYLKNIGITAVWFPPAMKCDLGEKGRGYDLYDSYDLGEFDQKGGVPTRYGTKDEYLKAIEKAHEAGISVYGDIVLNHRMGGDEQEKITVHEVKEDDRNKIISDPFTASAFTKFTFPGRKGKYSDFIWDHQCFSGIDMITKNNEKKTGIFKIHNQHGNEWNETVSHQFGNYDYLMGADIEYRNQHVVQEMKNWIKWYFETTKVDGLRLDALKHIPSDFLKDWITYIKTEIKKDCFILGEFWKEEVEKITNFSDKMDGLLSFFDAPLHYNFHKASEEGKDYNLSEILKDTFLEVNPVYAVSFVENHDTQKLQALESAVKDWFKPLAYTFILLLEKAYPCIFYPDLFGVEYTDEKDGKQEKVIIPKVEILSKLLEARQKYGYGKEVQYFDHPNCIAWVRTGDEEHAGCVVLISNSEKGFKEIELGENHANSKFKDFLGHSSEEITTNHNGKGTFLANEKSVSIWIKVE